MSEETPTEHGGDARAGTDITPEDVDALHHQSTQEHQDGLCVQEYELDERPYEDYAPWPSDRALKALLAGLLACAAAGSIEYVVFDFVWLQGAVAGAMALSLFIMGQLVGRRQ